MFLPSKLSQKLYKRRYAINFDLSIKALENYYSKNNPKGAYKEIQDYMEENGFSHRQYSGYTSNNTMTVGELQTFTMNLYNTFPWLKDCVEKLDATVISRIYDLKMMMESEIDRDLRDIQINSPDSISLD